MTEDIIQSITEAETKAAQIKEDAINRSAEIISEAEKKAAMTEKFSEESCKAFRTTEIKLAQAEGEKKFQAILAKKRVEAKDFADEILKSTELPVSMIVRRITGGDS